MPATRHTPPGYVVTYPNREKASSKATRAVVVLILLISIALMLAVTIGGWSKLEGDSAIDFAWCVIYGLIAFFLWRRWARGLLPIASALAILLLAVSLIAGLGGAGTSWFERSGYGYAPARSLFGGAGLSPDFLGLLTLLLAPVQILLILFAMRAFSQNWNIEVDVPDSDPRSLWPGASASAS